MVQQIAVVKAEKKPKEKFVCPLPDTVNFRDLLDADDALWPNVISYCKLMEDECVSKYSNLDIYLVSAVMMQESKGRNVLNYAGSGAVGLMQVMPDTVIPGRPTQDQLLDTKYNVQYGCGLLSNYITNHGSVEEGLASYGEGVAYSQLVLRKAEDIRSSQ